MNHTTTHSRKGVTLMEVLASIFVISIGLLGVLAVIPFGAFQVSKARNAEYASNMLDAARNDMKIMELHRLEHWTQEHNTNWLKATNKNGNQDIDVYLHHSTAADRRLNGTRFIMVDPFDDRNIPAPSQYFCKVGARFNGFGTNTVAIWQEMMRGQDDLMYNTYKDKRTDFASQGNRVASSGRYSWFFTFALPDVNSGIGRSNAPLGDYVVRTVDIDLLGCYDRFPDENSEREVAVDTQANSYIQTVQGAQVTLLGTEETLDLTKTKYIFLMWERSGVAAHEFQYEGQWCKIAYAPKEVVNGKKTIIVANRTSQLPATLGANPRALIIDGILYHTQMPGMEIF